MVRWKFQTHRIRLHLGIATIFVVIVAALTAAIIWNNRREASDVALETAEQLFNEITTKVDERVNRMLGSVRIAVDTVSAMPSLSDHPRYDGLSYEALESMVRVIESEPYVFAVYAGFGSADMIQVSAMRGDPDVRAAFQVPDGTHFIIRTITKDRDGKRRQYLRYLDRDRHVIGARTEPDPPYDPRSRPWYASALTVDRTLFTEPYVFFSLKKLGITGSRRLIGGGGVLGMDVTLSNYSHFLSEQRVSPNGVVFLFNSRGDILAHQDPSLAAPIAQEIEASQVRRLVLRKAGETGNPIVEAVVREGLAPRDDRFAMKQIQVQGKTYLVQVAPVGIELGLNQHIGIAVPLSDFTQHIAQMQERSLLFSVLALFIALPLIFLVAKRIATKLGTLAGEADKIRNFDLDSPVAVDSLILEVHRLSKAFESMKQGLQVFGRYVPRAIVQEIVQSGTSPELGGHRQEITILFTDISGFTRIAEGTVPEDLMFRMSEYFETLSSVLSRHNGVVDKYIGDAIMALWNAPNRDAHHVAHACAAVLACRNAGWELAERWRERELPVFRTRFGLHCGEAVVGNVGGADRMNFTAVGATINVASRLEGINKFYGTEILVSDDVARRVGDQYLMRLVDRVQPHGANEPIDIYELMAARAGLTELPELLEANEEQLELCAMWERAYETYVSRDWQAALEAFEAVLRRCPQDNPAQIYVRRCHDFVENGPDPDWNGVTLLTQK